MNSIYYVAQSDNLFQTPELPKNALPLTEGMERVLPPQISDLHMSLARWANLKLSPGEIIPSRIWLVPDGELYFLFSNKAAPKPLTQTGLASQIAAWLVLMDRWMETFVVIARARSVWTPDELASALTFMTPAFLPPAVIEINPQWEVVAEAVALAVIDGPLKGSHSDKHWKQGEGRPQPSGEPQTDWRAIFQRKSG